MYMIEELLENMLGGVFPPNIIALLVGLAMVIVFSLILFYVYSSLTLMFTARKLKEPDAWLAWIPVGNLILMSRLAKMPWWPALFVIGMFIPFIGSLTTIALMVFIYIWWWKITEARKMPGWIVLLSLIPILGNLWGFVLWGILAWKE